MEEIRDALEEEVFEERVVKINRVGKVVKGGKKIAFNAVVVVGNGQGKVGYGLGKALEVAEAIRKGVTIAKRNLIDVPVRDTTIPSQIVGRWNAAKIVLRPASRGTGVIAGGPARAVLELAGVQDVLTKSLGSSNSLNVIKATIDGLKKIGKDVERRQRRTEGQ